MLSVDKNSNWTETERLFCETVPGERIVAAVNFLGRLWAVPFVSDHPYFVGVQYHPEYISRPVRPSPPYLGLILAAINKLSQYIARGCRLSPRCSISEDEDDEDEELARLPEFKL